jgi:curved DNA-binding protein CbpA
MGVEPDAYATLGVDPGASAEVISAAYRRMARIYHPDGRSQDSRRMIEINRAYDRIKTPELRRQYDQACRRFVASGWAPAGAVQRGELRDSRPEWVRRAMAGRMRAKVMAR